MEIKKSHVQFFGTFQSVFFTETNPQIREYLATGRITKKKFFEARELAHNFFDKLSEVEYALAVSYVPTELRKDLLTFFQEKVDTYEQCSSLRGFVIWSSYCKKLGDFLERYVNNSLKRLNKLKNETVKTQRLIESQQERLFD